MPAAMAARKRARTEAFAGRAARARSATTSISAGLPA